MLSSSYCDHILDVAEQLLRFVVLARALASQSVNRYSERKDHDGSLVTPVELAQMSSKTVT